MGLTLLPLGKISVLIFAVWALSPPFYWPLLGSFLLQLFTCEWGSAQGSVLDHLFLFFFKPKTSFLVNVRFELTRILTLCHVAHYRVKDPFLFHLNIYFLFYSSPTPVLLSDPQETIIICLFCIILFMCIPIKYIQLFCIFVKFHVNNIEIYMLFSFSSSIHFLGQFSLTRWVMHS